MELAPGGDLGVELGHERVNYAQKLMIKQAKAAGLYPIITATQMMESMISHLNAIKSILLTLTSVNSNDFDEIVTGSL